MWAVVPVKDLRNVKTRLSPVLSLPERQRLFICMLQDVLRTLQVVPEIRGIVVVTRDRSINDIASRRGAVVLAEKCNSGHSDAVAQAAAWLSSRKEHGLVQVPGDIPNVTAAELSDVLAVHASGPAQGFSISPSHDHLGSNCIVCTPPDILRLSFGDDSFRKHLHAARSVGIEPAVVERPGIALDIDYPGDLRRLAQRERDTTTHDFLRRSGLRQRLMDVSASVLNMKEYV